MRVIFCLLILVLSFGGNAFGQKPFHAEINVGHYNTGSYYFNNDNLIYFEDGSYVVFDKSAYINGSFTRQSSVAKFDFCHNLLWRKKIPDYGRLSLKTLDNGILCTFNKDFFNSQQQPEILVKLDSNGQLNWSKKLDGITYIHSISNVNDGGYFVTGSYGELVSGQFLYSGNFIVKLNKDGTIEWSHKFLPKSGQWGKIMALPDNSAVLLLTNGWVNNNNYNNNNTSINRVDKDGRAIWGKNIEVPPIFNSNIRYLQLTDIAYDKDTNIYCAGQIIKEDTATNKSEYYQCIFKFSKTGKNLWSAIYSNNNSLNYRRFKSVAIKEDNTLVLASGDERNNSYLLNIDTSGHILSNNFYSASNGIISSCMAVDSEIITTGSNGLNQTSIIKTDAQNSTTCSQPDTNINFLKSGFPVQSSGLFFYQNMNFSDTSIIITDDKSPLKIKILCGRKDYPISDLDNDTIICNAKSFTSRAGEDNLGYGHKFMWSTGSTDSVITVTKSGKYWLAISSGYCTNTDTVNIVFREEIQSKIPDQSICPYDSVNIEAPNISGAKFHWIKPDKSIFKQHDIWAKDTGTYYLRLDGNGTCLNIDTFRLQHHKLPQASAGPDTVLCHNQSYEMQGKGGISYKWIPAKYLSNDAISNPIATAPDTQLYMLIVKNAFGCADTSQMWLRVKPKLQVKLTAKTTSVCGGEKVLLQAFASGGDSLHYTYNWQNSTGKEEAFETNLKQSSWVKITLEDGCSEPAKDSIFITVKPTPISAFHTDPKDSAIEGNKVQFINQSQHATNYQWSFGTGETSNSANPTYIYTDTGKYLITLIAQNTNGCSDTAYGQIYIAEKFRIFIPNAFTPDGDLNNDVFSVYGTGIKDYSYEIYNRWGERIFTSSATKPNWNGAVENRGEVVQIDVYFYVLKVKDIENRMHYFHGTINLLR